MSIRELAEDFERLQDTAMKITLVLEDNTESPSDAVMVLGMIAAYLINMHRQDGVTLDDAQASYFKLVMGLSALGEAAEKEILQ